MKKFIPHLIAVGIFLAISAVYVSPALDGQVLDMLDIKHHEGMKQELVEHRSDYNEEALWTNRMFSGMPAYLMGTKYDANLIQYVAKGLQLGLPRPMNMIFLYLIGFYILLLTLKIDYRLAIVGSIAFAFSSYFFIILQAGHMTKAHAIAYVPMVVAAVLYTYRGNMLLGGVLTSLAVALELYANHLQITYYLIIILLFIAAVQFYKDLKSKNLLDFAKRSSILLLAALLASGTSLVRLWPTMEYGEYSIRGKSELTSDMKNKTSGLDRDYATEYSYGISETMTLLIPNFHGGAQRGELDEDSDTYNAISSSPNAQQMIKQVPLYWGDQPITSGPSYAGAIVIFLFVLGIFYVNHRIRTWILLSTILAIMLAWGKNFPSLTNFFLDYFPGYNKFRAVSMMLVVAEFTLPLLGIIALSKFLTEKDEIDEFKINALKKSFFIVGGLTLLFAIMPSIFLDFKGPNDLRYQEQQGWPISQIESDREWILIKDAFRSFIFISLSFATLWFFVKKRIQIQYVIFLIGFLILVDMWTINKRYLNDTHFIIEEPHSFIQTQADIEIQKDTGEFRVYNTSVRGGVFADASTSYFHNSIGGYHGAKLRRYQELYDHHIINTIDTVDPNGKETSYFVAAAAQSNILSMLNTRWFIEKLPINPNKQKEEIVANQWDSAGYNSKRIKVSNADRKQPLGNAWFIQNLVMVNNADAEIDSLSDFDPSKEAFVDKRFASQIKKKEFNPEGCKIKLKSYKANHLTYELSNIFSDQLVVFSEIYYKKGWNAYVDGKKVPHFRVNYVLRAMNVPKGTKKIEFKFEPESYATAEPISLASSIILLLLLGFVSFKEFLPESYSKLMGRLIKSK